MSYLFGDSSPSPLETDFMSVLGDALDFCVHVLLADDRITQARAEMAGHERATAAEIERLEALGVIVKRAAAQVPKAEASSRLARCADSISTEVDRLVQGE